MTIDKRQLSAAPGEIPDRTPVPRGRLIMSGPTETALYRLGRRVAGFDGHYHETTIYEIEAAAARLLDRCEVQSVLLVAPLFEISARAEAS